MAKKSLKGFVSKVAGKIQGSGIVSKIVSGIPVVGGFAAAAVDIGSKFLGKMGVGNGGASSVIQDTIKNYQGNLASIETSARESGVKTQEAAVYKPATNVFLYIGIAAVVLFGFIMLKKR